MPLPDKIRETLRLPVIAAPMFLASGLKLVSACCREGIIGTFPAKNARTAKRLESWLIKLTENHKIMRSRTGQNIPPFGVNLIVHRSNVNLKKELSLCVKYKVPIIITSLGAVPELVNEVHAYGGLIFHDVINTRHAKKASDAGVDGLIAVSTGAGGHTGLTSPFALVNEIRSWFDGTLILAGAISTGADIAAAQTLGADLAYLGTRFIATKECEAVAAYKSMILDSVAADVATTDIVSGITANFMLQSLENAGIDLREPEAKAPKTQHEFKNKKKQKEYNLKPWRDIWSAGHGVGSINDIPTVSELVDRLRNEYIQACLGQQKNLVSLKNTCL